MFIVLGFVYKAVSCEQPRISNNGTDVACADEYRQNGAMRTVLWDTQHEQTVG